MRLKNLREALTVMASGAAFQICLAQVESGTVLEVQLENAVSYVSDVSAPAEFATNPNPTPPRTAPRNFGSNLVLADIVAVNGTLVTGTAIIGVRTINLRTSAGAGLAIADTVRNSISDYALEILQTDGTPVGSIFASGLSGGAAPPGAPSAAIASSNAVVGGTGAFLGMRGQLSGGRMDLPIRSASLAEDPSYRRTHGGGRFSIFVHLLPSARPEILNTPNGPAVVHSSDFSLVTVANPARSGEILSLLATGLGPTRPGLDPGKRFPSSPLAAVNTPVEVIVNGKLTDVLGAVGYPESVNNYQVNFRMPVDTESGWASIQLTSAWIAGPEVQVRVQ